jgi:hypothetical protein
VACVKACVKGSRGATPWQTYTIPDALSRLAFYEPEEADNVIGLDVAVYAFTTLEITLEFREWLISGYKTNTY